MMLKLLQMRYFVVLIVMATLLAVAGPASAVVVTFPDANLEASVRTELDIPSDPITDTDMETLESLSAYNSSIANIQGLEYGTNLVGLLLDNNQISDISPLAGLTNLSSLYMYNNQVSNISPVAGLTKLTHLNLYNNQISDISSMTGLTNLNDLRLHNNQISDISPLAGLTDLTHLALYNNQITDISPVAVLTNLNHLSLGGNQITDISLVAGLPNLNYLNLGEGQISDISPVAGLTNLTSLYLQCNQISDISPLARLTDLKSLQLYDNQISDISPLAGMTNLVGLLLDNNQISDISPVAGMTNLRYLYLDNNQIETMDLSSVDLSSLEYFTIGSNPLTSVLLVDATLSQTSFNTLMDSQIWNHNGIGDLPGVLSLDMSGVDFAAIADLSKMYTMNDLETLLLKRATNLDGSRVVPLTVELDSMNWLDVTGTWDSFDAAAQSSLNAWDAIQGNTLVVPEPGSIALLVCGAIGLLAYGWRRRRTA